MKILLGILLAGSISLTYHLGFYNDGWWFVCGLSLLATAIAVSYVVVDEWEGRKG